MSGVKIKDIEGCLAANKETRMGPQFYINKAKNEGFNEAITQQGQVKIVLNRDKLWDILEKVNPSCGSRIRQAYVNSIIANLPTLLEVVKE